MATILGFQVHTDKENEVPVLRPIDKSLKGQSLQAFPCKSGNKLSNPTPRKALGSVNQQIPAPQGFKAKGSDISKRPVESLIKSKKAVGDENALAGLFSKKAKGKKSPGLHSGLKNQSSRKITNRPKTPKVASKAPFEFDPIPKIPDDVESDSDEAILPRNDRLSCYVDKLLTWRPPCLFGTLPDSDSEDYEEELNFDVGLDLEQIRISLPPVTAHEDDLPQDLSLMDLTPLSPLSFPSPSHLTAAFDSFTEPSPDTSLHLGELHFGTPEPALDLMSES